MVIASRFGNFLLVLNVLFLKHKYQYNDVKSMMQHFEIKHIISESKEIMIVDNTFRSGDRCLSVYLLNGWLHVLG